MISNFKLFLIIHVEWLLLTETASASFTKDYAGYVFTFDQNAFLSKDGAQTWCSHNGSKLLEIKSSYVQTLVVQFLNYTGVYFADATLLFTGGVRNDFSGGWNWVNGRSINSITVSGQGSDKANSFGFISVNPSRIYIVASVPTETRGYICQDKFDCTTGFMLNELCHKIYTSPAMTWFDARNRCLNEGGDLASFDFINDDRGFNSTLYGSWFSSSTTYWIGIRRQSWMWQTSNLEVNYTNWLNGRPVYRMENLCLCLYKSGSDWKWIECNCNSPFQFVCLIEQPTTPSTLSSTSAMQVTTINSTTRATALSGSNGVALSSTTYPLYSNSSKMEASFSTTVTPGDKRDLGIGIGVGIGGALIIAAVIIVVFLIVRKRGCSRKSNPPDVILHPLESHYAEIPKQTGYETGSTLEAYYSNESTSPVVYSDLEILTGSSPSSEKDSFSLIGSKTATLAPPNAQKGTTHFTVDSQEYAEVNKEVRT